MVDLIMGLDDFIKKTGKIETPFEKKENIKKTTKLVKIDEDLHKDCLLYTSPSPRDRTRSRMPSSA